MEIVSIFPFPHPRFRDYVVRVSIYESRSNAFSSRLNFTLARDRKRAPAVASRRLVTPCPAAIYPRSANTDRDSQILVFFRAETIRPTGLRDFRILSMLVRMRCEFYNEKSERTNLFSISNLESRQSFNSISSVSESQSRYLVHNYENGALLRIEPVRPVRDNTMYECLAENGVGDAVSAEAQLRVYEGTSLCILFLDDH